MQTQPKTVNRTLPDEPGFKTDTEFQKKFTELSKEVEDLKSTASAAQRKLMEASGKAVKTQPQDAQVTGGEPENKETSQTGASSAVSNATPVRPARTQNVLASSSNVGFATEAMSFGSTSSPTDETSAVLPVGSFVRAKLLSGVESISTEPFPALLQLQVSFVGPNKTRIDLSNCFMIAKARANLSTERVIMETETISCVKENGEAFKSSAKGYTAGSDNSFGSTGKFISKQGQVLLAAVLASIAKNAGQAISSAQQTTTVAGADKAATATNITGSKAAFVAGSSVVDGATLIAQWYLDYARQLLPSIALGSGADVTVVMLESIKIPRLNSAKEDEYPWTNLMGGNQ